MKTITPIEKRIELAKLKLTELEKIRMQKLRITTNFKFAMNCSDAQNRRNAGEWRYISTYWGYSVIPSLSSAKKVGDLVLTALAELNLFPERYIPCYNPFRNAPKIMSKIEQYFHKAWNRRINEKEYLELASGSEPTIGKYLKQAYLKLNNDEKELT